MSGSEAEWDKQGYPSSRRQGHASVPETLSGGPGLKTKKILQALHLTFPGILERTGTRLKPAKASTQSGLSPRAWPVVPGQPGVNNRSLVGKPIGVRSHEVTWL